jgi:hypothetical protein
VYIYILYIYISIMYIYIRIYKHTQIIYIYTRWDSIGAFAVPTPLEAFDFGWGESSGFGGFAGKFVRPLSDAVPVGYGSMKTMEFRHIRHIHGWFCNGFSNLPSAHCIRLHPLISFYFNDLFGCGSKEVMKLKTSLVVLTAMIAMIS